MNFIIVIITAVLIQITYLLYINYYSANNVCKTYKDYYTNRDQNENCYYNPDSDLTVPEIIIRHQYPLDTHQVISADGYILSLFRIPNTRNLHKKNNSVLLEHGFAGNSASFVGKGKKSLAFLLSDEGYDVWIANFRGTKYSKAHTYLNNNDSEYWNFSFHETGTYDIPAILDFIANTTNQKVICIGFSIGALSNYVYASIYPDLASERVELFVSMAPTAFLKNIGYPMRFLLTVINYSYAKNLLPFDKVIFSEDFVKRLCLPYPFQMELCYAAVYYSTGYYYKQMDPETVPVLLLQGFDSFSAKTFAHFSQLFVYGKSRQFDYSPEMNLKVYGSEEPPDYNFSKLSVETYIIRTNDETLATKETVEELYNALPKAYNPFDIHVIDIPHFSHMDFLFGKDADLIVYDHIINFLSSR